MGLLIIIGVVLTLYGGLSLRFPKKLKEQNRDRRKREEKYLSWYLNIYTFGGMIALITGILLIIAGAILY